MLRLYGKAAGNFNKISSHWAPEKSTHLDRNRHKVIDHVSATIAVALCRLSPAA
jgi:hypothetical protein